MFAITGSISTWLTACRRILRTVPSPIPTLPRNLTIAETLFPQLENSLPVEAVSGVNYFFGLTTTISPYQRQLPFDS